MTGSCIRSNDSSGKVIPSYGFEWMDEVQVVFHLKQYEGWHAHEELHHFGVQ
jgi:hypothetical protein